ncbi:MAG: hydantoinase B/oxoprolinase family protein, partial [Deltaproteobacteria bacterium]|nr:hydantoinase B/oxoprolinase family protein [Deltaproteobacteria bacterium]
MAEEPTSASVAILQRRLKGLTREMGLSLLHTARSPILAEARDFVTGLYDAQGRMLEQTEYIPVLAFAVQPALRSVIDRFAGDVGPGDVIFHNDVFTGGNQLADVCVFRPIFRDSELIAWAAAKGHQADIGGAVGGGYNPRATEVWQEGLRIPPVKVVEGGRVRKDVWDFLFANIRHPAVAEDLRAAMGACVVGERNLHRILERTGLDA